MENLKINVPPGGKLKVTYRKVFIDEDPNQPEVQEPCPDCRNGGLENMMEYMFINIDLAIYKCVSCMYPHQDFKYKNYKDQTVYRLEILEVFNELPPVPTDEFTSEFSSLFDTSNPLPQAYSFQSQPVEATFNADDQNFELKQDAFEKLESELGDLLSDHLDLSDSSLKEKPPKPPDPAKSSISSLPQSLSSTATVPTPPPKKRKLSKAYEFLEKTLGTKSTSKSGPFKVPSRPTRNIHRTHFEDFKLPKEVKSPLKAQQPSLFLKNIERQNVLLTDLNAVNVPVKIEILAPLPLDFNVTNIKVENLDQTSE